MIKQNHTVKQWLASKSIDDQEKLLKLAQAKAANLRAKHAEDEKEITKKTKERLDEVYREKVEREACKVEFKRRIIIDVTQHGGPCRQPTDVDKLLTLATTKSKKLELVKNEVRYLQHILGLKDKRLVFGKKDAETLADDLKAVLAIADISFETAPVAITTETSESVDVVNVFDKQKPEVKRKPSGDAAQRPTKKTKAYSESNSENTNTTIKLFEEFKFSKQGCIVAVAYDTDYYIGEVVTVENGTLATVQFMNRGFRNMFRWPQVDDIAAIEAKYVFASDFEVLMAKNGRTWTVPELTYIVELYEQYRSTYFMPGC